MWVGCWVHIPLRMNCLAVSAAALRLAISVSYTSACSPRAPFMVKATLPRQYPITPNLVRHLPFFLVSEPSMYIARNSGLSSFSAMNLVWSLVHCFLTDSPCWLGGRNMTTHSMLSTLVSCHGVVASGQILLVFSWARLAMQDMQVWG